MRVESRLCLSWFKQYFGSMPGNSISPNYSKPARCLFYTISGVLESGARPAALPTAGAKRSFPISVHPALWRDLPEERGNTWGLSVLQDGSWPGCSDHPSADHHREQISTLPFPSPVEEQSSRKTFLQSTRNEHLCKDWTSHAWSISHNLN